MSGSDILIPLGFLRVRPVVWFWGVLLCVAAATQSLPAQDDWRAWRGPNANGIAAAGQQPPTNWGPEQNIFWQAPVPGRGHSSPIVVGNRVVLTTADERAQLQSVLCYERTTGELLWKADVNRGGFPRRIHVKNTHATPTPCSDGEHIYAAFHNHDGVQLVALSLDGEVIWDVKAGPYEPRAYEYGYAASPVLYGDSIIVAADFETAGFLTALDRGSGRRLWRTARPSLVSYSSPIVGTVAGRDQLLISGCDAVASYDPRNGKLLWACPGTAKATCGTVVWDGNLVFASGGYPQKETIAVRGDGSRRVAWRNREKCYEQSLLVHDGFVYAVNDSGIAFCWEARTGRERWKSRLYGPVSASPILAGGHIYVSNERGTTFVYRETPERFELVAQNQLGDEAFATPTICGNQIFLRVAETRDDERRETLYCIGK